MRTNYLKISGVALLALASMSMFGCGSGDNTTTTTPDVSKTVATPGDTPVTGKPGMANPGKAPAGPNGAPP